VPAEPAGEQVGRSLHFAGRGTGTVLLFTHGWGATSYMFESTARRLAARSCTVVWDLPGHGRSDGVADPIDVAGTIDDMIGLLDRFGEGHGVLIGHSLGGYLSLELARNQPGRVDALVLVGTGPGFRDEEARARWNRFTERLAQRIERRGLDALERERPLHGGRHRSAESLVRSARGLLPQTTSAVLESLPELAAPALVVVGEDDTEFRAAADYMAAKIPGARLSVVEGAGHSPNLDRPDAFEQVVGDFLDEHGL
jgi:pimeloyl-ACP methyl ester carboxylesterase